MKKICSILLSAILLFACAVPAHAAQAPSITPLWVNTTQANVTFSISSTGLAIFDVTVLGNSSATGISTVTYLERKYGSSWMRVFIDSPNDEYTENTTSRYLIKSYSENLQIKGEYKVTCNVTVYGKTQNETFKLTKTYTYD